ncbi:NAD(P)-dependent alcohol dehydrogenase [Actinoplanes sp. ATCC 53533]|uniref:NAD(P)-dependent alcohol dehydrogenase n=1 Tax=Actinoplanes sp. ATCC 53533 TaxID=1288362 RepID=UPI000F76D52E|nr:NAD(P)-dependent alcohol dehydrogenase [Actinoplanes sp. ATCC 53533]RSM46845.1 NAD(P)-dependent alcohol dehydrogenase [Actinoplanes sp. ATCC 53533]
MSVESVGNLAAVLHSPGDLRISERPMPAPGPGEVLVKVSSVGICGSDVHYYEHGRIGDYVVESPMVLGHEAGGVVVELGPGVTTIEAGRRVAIEPGVPCGHCEQCRRGTYNLCPGVRFFATPPIDGALARYVTVNAAFAHPVPDALSDDAAALIEPLSVGIWANRRAATGIGSRVLVTGAGPIGVLAALAARAAGAGWVGLADVHPARLKAAGEFDVDSVIDARDTVDYAAFRPEVLLECTGSPAVASAGIRSLRPLGRAVLVGMSPSAEQSLPVQAIQNRELSVTGTFRYAHTYPDAISLVAAGRIDLDALVGARLPLAETERALTMGRTDPAVLKTVVAVQE